MKEKEKERNDSGKDRQTDRQIDRKYVSNKERKIRDTGKSE